MTSRLTPAEIGALLVDLPRWTLDDAGTGICRDFAFADFRDAFAFMSWIALKAEMLNHHPEWKNVYNRVEVRLSTHEFGGVSLRDVELAQAMEKIEARLLPPPPSPT